MTTIEHTDKYRIYIDESGNCDLGHCEDPNHRFLSLTGVIVKNDHAINSLTPEMQELKDKHFGLQLDKQIIFHRSDMANKRGQFSCFHDETIKRNFNLDLLKKFSEWDFRTITVLIDKKQFIEKYLKWKENPYHYCLRVLIERYCHFLERNNAVGDVMIEARTKSDDRMLSDCFTSIYINGTDYMQAESFQKVLTSKSIKIRCKKENIAGLQLADLIAVPLRNRILEQEYKRTFESEHFGKQVYSAIKDKIYSVNKTTWGYGMKKLP